jgi:voltage-gated potassium channel Kch
MDEQRTTDHAVVDIDLTDDEWLLTSQAINEYWGPAGNAKLLIGPIFGVKNSAQWDALLQGLYDAVVAQQPLTDLDWARALFLTEISVSSELVGARLDSPTTVNCSDVFDVPRSIQVKLSGYTRFILLLQNSDCWLPESEHA